MLTVGEIVRTFLNFYGPVVGIGGLRVLDAHDGVVELLGQRRGPPAVDDHALALVGELAHWRDDRRRARAEDFLEGARLVGRHHLVDGDLTLARLDAPVLEQGEHGIAGHSGQYRASQRRRDHLSPDLDHDVHGPHLVDGLAMDAVHPQDLGQTLVLRLLARHEARRVVGARLGPAQPSVPGRDVALLYADLHWGHGLR